MSILIVNGVFKVSRMPDVTALTAYADGSYMVAETAGIVHTVRGYNPVFYFIQIGHGIIV